MTPEANEAFRQLKLHLTSAPTLQIFDPNQPTRMLADASDVATGAILE